jgi:hypothetical protein
MRIARTFAILGSAALLSAPGIAAAAQAEAPCLTPAEFTALSSYALPSVITGVSQQCSATLPGEAYLNRSGDQLAQRYSARKAAAWPGAKAAFMKFSGSNAEAAQLFKAMPDDALQPLLDGIITSMIATKLPTAQCVTIDRFVSLLAPLPPENTAELIALAAGLGAKSGKARVGQFSLCTA